MGPRGVNIADMRNREATAHGWRIPYFMGDDFEVIYEYICARNGTGVIKNADKDKCVRVLAGSLYVTVDGEIKTILTGQAYALLRDTEYELSSSGDTDVEVLICQNAGYEDTVEYITQPTATNPVMANTSPQELPPRNVVSKEKAKRIAEDMKRQRDARTEAKKSPVKRGTVENELGEQVPPPVDKRIPLSGQQVVGVNPMPVGAGGYSGDK
jgi:mannose-6-phosphate isomerase-like protein (cupin superfamily)